MARITRVLRNSMDMISITITNLTGATQSYGIFAAEPQITPKALDLQNDFFTVFRGVASGDNGGRAYFTMPRYDLSAICGTLIRGPVDSGLHYEVSDRTKVTLGSAPPGQNKVLGTTCEVIVDLGNPVFNRKLLNSVDQGELDSFCVQTRNDFTFKEATANRFFLGFGITTTTELAKNIGPFALFCPEPGTLYQIKPSTTFYVIAGDYTVRGPTRPELEKRAFEFDLQKMQTTDIALVHGPHGEWILKTAQ